MKETPKDGAPAPKHDPAIPDVGGGYVSDPPHDCTNPTWPTGPNGPGYPQFPITGPEMPWVDPPNV